MVKKISIFIFGLFLLVVMSSFVHAAAIDLVWDPPEDGGEVEGYIVYASTTKGDYSDPAAVEIVQETYATVSWLDTSQSYYFIVKAYNCAGIGEASNEVYVEANSDTFYDDGSGDYFDNVEKSMSGGCFVTNMDHVSSPESWNRSVVQSIGILVLIVMAVCLFPLNRRKTVKGW